MGNWRRVNIVGSCDPEDIPALAKALDPGREYENLHCLSNGGIVGLPMWAARKINATGNLAERNYTVQDVADQLEELAVIASSLAVKVHCGADFEKSECIATITLSEGKATIGDAEIQEIPETPKEQRGTNLLTQLVKQRDQFGI